MYTMGSVLWRPTSEIWHARSGFFPQITVKKKNITLPIGKQWISQKNLEICVSYTLEQWMLPLSWMKMRVCASSYSQWNTLMELASFSLNTRNHHNYCSGRENTVDQYQMDRTLELARWLVGESIGFGMMSGELIAPWKFISRFYFCWMLVGVTVARTRM